MTLDRDTICPDDQTNLFHTEMALLNGPLSPYVSSVILPSPRGRRGAVRRDTLAGNVVRGTSGCGKIFLPIEIRQT